MDGARHASEEQYRMLFAAMDQGLCVIEKVTTPPGAPSDFRFLDVNPAFLRHTRLLDPVGKTILELVPDAEPEIIARYDRVVATGKAERFEAYVAGIDLWMEADVYPAQEPGQVAVLFTNITERKRTTEALRASKERLATLLENLPDYAIFLVDPDGVVIEWTEGAERVKGYTPEEIVGQHFSLFYTPEDQAARVPDRILAEAARTGRSESEGWRVRKSGACFWGNEIATAVRDEAGNLVGFTKISRDLTERRQAEAALAQSEERYRRIVEQATDYAIFSIDAERRVETWPAGAQHVFGWTAAEAVGQVIDITYTPEDRAASVPEGEFRAALTDGVAPNIRWHQRKDGTRVFIDGMTYARHGEEGAFKVGQDVTARVLAEDARRADEEWRREELEAEVAAATRELRTLSHRLLLVQEEERRNLARELHDEIGQVLTGLNFQLASATGTAGLQALEEAKQTVSVLTEQVRQLSMDLRPAVLDHYGLIAALEWHLARYQQQTGIQVTLRHEGLEERLAPEVEITAFRVVQEALTNAARHARSETVTVHLLADDTLTIVVRDDGQGFDLGQVSITRGLGGMRERVALLGGALEIESTPGQGTSITAELPVVVPTGALTTATSWAFPGGAT
jgi:PAS domain S-box-containing protein